MTLPEVLALIDRHIADKRRQFLTEITVLADQHHYDLDEIDAMMAAQDAELATWRAGLAAALTDALRHGRELKY
jgi:2C-methyl-D-erythritol 2,4-cyclodiphosphate synthase